MKVSNMQSTKMNDIPNQFIIKDSEVEVFQSYSSIIVKIIGNTVYLDENKWNYSKTTSRYRSLFLGESTKETKSKIESGEYILCDLNNDK